MEIDKIYNMDCLELWLADEENIHTTVENRAQNETMLWLADEEKTYTNL